MIQPYFDNIRSILLQNLNKAENTIIVAVYWFTNLELFEALLDKLREGIDVKLIIHNDFINNRNNGLPFQKFIDNGGEFHFSNNENPMHNKFCVIDGKTLINGSYNWTYYAENKNRENVLLIENEKETIQAFTLEFETLKSLTEKVIAIKQLTRFEIEENNILSSRDYLANDIVFQAKETNNKNIIKYAFEIAPRNIEVQKKAFGLDLTKKYRLKHTIGSSVIDDGVKVIAKKGMSLPIISSAIVRTSFDNQVSCICNIIYGESEKASENKKIGTMRISGLPKKPKGDSEMKFRCFIDLYGKIRIEHYSLDNGNSARPLEKDIKYLIEEIIE